jgi:hypothetical protein
MLLGVKRLFKMAALVTYGILWSQTLIIAFAKLMALNTRLLILRCAVLF